MPRKVKLIFNPIANLGRAWPVASALRPLVQELGGADWSGTVYPTHATELACQAGNEGYDMVVAMGGDGTIHEVVNGLMQVPAERRPKLGIVPIGTGNDMAFSLGISKNPEEALRQVMAGTPHPLDLGLIIAKDSSGSDVRQEYFANTLGIGFDTVVAIRSRRVPVLQGFAVYFVAVLQTILLNYVPFHTRIQADGQLYEDDLLMLVMANGRREGGGFLIAPQASTQDGQMESIAVQKISVPRMLMTIPAFLKGTHAGLPYVRTGNFTVIDCATDRPMHIHTDGEIFAGLGSDIRHIRVETLPGALITVT